MQAAVKDEAEPNTTYLSNMDAIRNDIFDCRKPEHAAAFKKSLKKAVDYICCGSEVTVFFG